MQDLLSGITVRINRTATVYLFLILNLWQRILNTQPVALSIAMAETLELDSFDVNFSFKCPKCDYLNEEVSAQELSAGNTECGMCETVFKLEGLDAIKITATLE
jgi:hypothetical protein